jgi:hypothetical protein
MQLGGSAYHPTRCFSLTHQRFVGCTALRLHVVSVNARFPQQKFVSGQYKSLMFLTGHSFDLLVHEIFGGTN